MSSAIISQQSPLTFSDDFNRADGSLGSNWSGTGIQIISNAVYSTTGGVSVLNSTSIIFPPDQEAQLTFTVKQTFDYIGAGVRMGTGYTGYALAIDGASNSVSGLQRLEVTGQTRIAEGSWAISNVGDVFRLRIVGNVITVFKNDAVVAQVTDNTYTSGQPGILYIRDNINGTRGDNFIAKSMRSSVKWSSTGTLGRVIGSST